MRPNKHKGIGLCRIKFRLYNVLFSIWINYYNDLPGRLAGLDIPSPDRLDAEATLQIYQACAHPAACPPRISSEMQTG